MRWLSRWYSDLSVRGKLLVPFIAVFAIESLVVALVAGSSLQTRTYAEAHRNLRSLATVTSQSLGNSAQALGQQASLIAAQSNLGQAVTGRDVAGITTTLAQIAWPAPPFLVQVVDNRGRALASIFPDSILQQLPPDLTHMQAALAVGQTAAVLSDGRGRGAYLIGAAPIAQGARQVGRLLLLSRLDDGLLQNLNPGSGHELAVVASGRVVASTLQGVSGERWETSGSTTTNGAVRTLAGQPRLIDAVPLRMGTTGSALWVVATAPLAPVRSSTAATWQQTWALFAAGIIVAVLTALLIAARIARPLRELTTATARLSDGDLAARAAVHSRDEIGTLALAFNHMAAELKERAARLDRVFGELRRLSETDSLTGLLNRRTIQQHLDDVTARACLSAEEFAFIMFDLDGFKLLNDTYGHPAGDRVIKQVARHLQELSRSGDRAGRWGGDEFILILERTSVFDAERTAQRLRTALAEAPFITPDGRRIPLRVSAGVAGFPGDAQDANQLIACADANLYASKARGGDLITSTGDVELSGASGSTTFGMLEALVTTVDNKDSYTRRHSEQVTAHALAIAEIMRLSPDTQSVLRVAGLLHDVGKIGVPDRILRKPGRLTKEELEVMRQHPLLGESLVTSMADGEDIRAAVATHHERFDGGGYPHGLAGNEIPMLGRILAVADSYSAMVTDRRYRTALSEAEALHELRLGAGTQFDPRVVDAFLRSRRPRSVESVREVASG